MSKYKIGDVVTVSQQPFIASYSSMYGKDLTITEVKPFDFASGTVFYYTVKTNDNETTEIKEDMIQRKMEQGGEVNKKIIVNNYNGELEYTNQDIQEMIDEIDMYISSDNLPAWLYKSGIAGTPGFPKNKKQVLSTLENIKNSKNDVYININSKEPYYKHVIKMEHGGNLAQENNEMLRNQAKEAKHHVEELHNVVTNKTNVEPWVIAKMERATTDLSDITHYLDGKKPDYNAPIYAFGGMIEDLSSNAIDRMNGLVPNSTLIEFLNNATYIINDMEQEGFEKDEILSYLSYKMVESSVPYSYSKNKFETGGGVDSTNRYDNLMEEKYSLLNKLDSMSKLDSRYKIIQEKIQKLTKQIQRLENKMANGGGVGRLPRQRFALYTNPNNVTNFAYVVIGNMEVKELLQSAREYPGSYRILYEGRGTNEDLQKMKSMFSNYRFGNEQIMANGGGVDEDFVVFSVDDDELDALLNDFHKNELDYVDINGDSYYKLNRRDFDRFIDAADSRGFDVDYENDEDSVIYVMENYANGGSIDHLKVGSKIGFLRPRTGRYEWAEVLSIDGDNVNLVVRHPKRRQWDNYFTETKERIKKYTNTIDENWNDGKNRTSMKIKFEDGGSIDSEIDNIDNRIYNLQQLKEVGNDEDQDYYDSQIKKLEKEKADLIEKQNKPVKRGWLFKQGGQTVAQKKKIEKVMHEFKEGKLRSGSKKGPIVTDRDQAIAIALSEANASKYGEGGIVEGARVKILKGSYVGRKGVIYDVLFDENGNIENNEVAIIVDIPQKPLIHLRVEDILIDKMEKGGEVDSISKSDITKMQKINIKGFEDWMPGVKYVYYDKNSNKYYYDAFGGYFELRNIRTLEELELFLKNKKSKGGWSHRK